MSPDQPPSILPRGGRRKEETEEAGTAFRISKHLNPPGSPGSVGTFRADALSGKVPTARAAGRHGECTEGTQDRPHAEPRNEGTLPPSITPHGMAVFDPLTHGKSSLTPVKGQTQDLAL